MAQQMTPYDARAWAEISHWKEERESRRVRRLLPQVVHTRAVQAGSAATDRLDHMPRVEQFEKLFLSALTGISDLGRRVATASVRDGAVVRGYQKRGHQVEALEDIEKLELRDVDKVKPRLDIAYSTAATLEGAGAGFIVSGGELVATVGSVFGAGAGAAPGVGTVIGTMAADAAAVLVAGHRAVAHIGAYYGYDTRTPEEQLFALGVLGVGTATGAGKTAAYVELNKVVQGLAQRQAWQQLNEYGLTRVVSGVYTRLGFRITQRKLGQAIPVVGIVLGAGLNARLLARIADDADHLYRERFLREKYGLHVDVDPAPPRDDETVYLADIIDAELVEDPQSDEGRGGADHHGSESGPDDAPGGRG